MMQTIAYKLSEYKIIENVYGDLVWECHFGLGTLKNGKCFINGDILYLMPGVNAGPGFLKGEFLDHLKKLPKWEKTKYYCTSYKIYECKPNISARVTQFIIQIPEVYVEVSERIKSQRRKYILKTILLTTRRTELE